MSEQPDRIPPPDLGIHEDIEFGRYLSWDAMSQSAAKPLARSPQHYLAYLRRQENTKALRTGHITDTLVFEPKLFSKNYKVKPRTYTNDNGEVKPWHGGAQACKDWMEEAERSGKIIISGPEYDEAVRLSTAVREHDAAKDILAEGKSQLSMVWADEETGIICKGRIDWLCGAGIVDLKTTKDAGPEPHQFGREIVTYGYHVQGAFYHDGYEQLTGEDRDFIIIAAEKGSPHAVAVYRVGSLSLQAGRSIYRRALYNYRQCKQWDEWPGYSQYIEPLDIPRWALIQELGNEAEGHNDDAI